MTSLLLLEKAKALWEDLSPYSQPRANPKDLVDSTGPTRYFMRVNYPHAVVESTKWHDNPVSVGSIVVV